MGELLSYNMLSWPCVIIVNNFIGLNCVQARHFYFIFRFLWKCILRHNSYYVDLFQFNSLAGILYLN